MRVAISGAAGYTGGELLRLLLGHPNLEVACVSSSTFTGQPVHKAHPNLQGRSALSFVESIDPTTVDCVFLSGGHGDAMQTVPKWVEAGGALKIIDLSGDFRLKDAALYPVWYGREHTAPEMLKQFTYGLTELNREAVEKSTYIANPGCFATAVALALAPLARAGAAGVARITAITGSSGSGAQAKQATHHPLREGSLHAYKPLKHQHTPEIGQLIGGKLGLAIVPVSGPLVRGIYAVCHVDLPPGWDAAKVNGLFKTAYSDCPFIRLQDEPPHLNAVTGSNYCDIFAVVEGRQIAVIAALDNLVKGAAGQAIQNLNVMMGWEETAGLQAAGLYP